MQKLSAIAGTMLILISLGSPSSALAQKGSGDRPDPNEKICEDIIPVGTRLAVKRVCATRAQWEAKRRSDRDWVDKAQREVCVVNPLTGKC